MATLKLNKAASLKPLLAILIFRKMIFITQEHTLRGNQQPKREIFTGFLAILKNILIETQL